MSDPFESYIESELQLRLGPLVRAAVPPYAGRFVTVALAAGFSMAAGPSLLAALTGKTAATVVVVTLAAGGGGAVAATVATGSPDPAVWTREGRAAVAIQAPARELTSSAPAAPAAAGPGHARAAAGQPGAAVSTPARAHSEAPAQAKGDHGNGNGRGTGAGNGNGNGRAKHHAEDDTQPSRPPHK